MNNIRIKELEEKYWNAETSLEEEKELKLLIQNDSGSDSIHMLFKYFEKERSLSTEKSLKIPVKNRKNLRFIYWISSIAASLVILFSVYTVVNPTPQVNPNLIAIEDQEEAYKVTMTALSILSGQLSRGEKEFVKGLSQIDRTMIFN